MKMVLRSILSLLLLSFLVTPLFGQSLRFAWLSDTHVGSPTGASDLREAVRTINTLPGITFVLISGDVSEGGTNAQLREAHLLLGSLHVQYHIIPGNHDMKWSESGGTMFGRLWGSDRFIFEEGPYVFVGMHQGPRMRMGDGHWAPEDVRWLDTVLARDLTPGKRLVFVTHYPLDSSITNWYEVLDRLKRVNTIAILHGHGHNNRLTDYEGIPGIMSRSDLADARRPAGFSIVEIDDDSLRVKEMKDGGNAPVEWCAISLKQHPLAETQKTYLRPQLSPDTGTTGPHSLWKVALNYTPGGPAAVDQDQAFVGDASGMVHALALSDGKELWRFKTHGPVWGAPAIVGKRVIVGSADGGIYCIDTKTGSQIWRFATNEPVVSAPAVVNNIVYVGGSDSVFRAIDLRTGRLVWQFKGMGGYVETRPLVLKDMIVFGAWDSYLYALKRKNGDLLWRWQGDRPGVLYSPAACWPVAARGRIFIVAPDRKMSAINAATGETVWRSDAHQVRETVGLSRDSSLVFVRTMRDTILALDARADVPRVVWSSDAGFGYDINSAMLVERDGTLFYGTKDGLVLALDAKTGEVRWTHRVAIGLLQTLTPVGGKKVLCVAVDGSVVLLDEGKAVASTKPSATGTRRSGRVD